jgi:hypothetical protein
LEFHAQVNDRDVVLVGEAVEHHAAPVIVRATNNDIALKELTYHRGVSD